MKTKEGILNFILRTADEHFPDWQKELVYKAMDQYATQRTAEVGWISVKDRLPEGYWEGERDYKTIPNISEQVNICTNLGVVGTAAYVRDEKVWFCESAIDYYNGKGILGKDNDIRVTHWQPLPEPPKNSEEKGGES